MDKITLFDPEPDLGKRNNIWSSTDYGALATSDDKDFLEVRNMLEEWFLRYPISGKRDLKERFQSAKKSGFHGAFFELFLYELHLKLGAKVAIHKETKTKKNTLPDFYIEDELNDDSYVEATVVTGVSQKGQAERKRLSQLLDNLNKSIVLEDYLLALESEGYPSRPTSAKQISTEINKKMEELDYGIICELFQKNNFDQLPRWSFNANGCKLIFEPIPIIGSKRGTYTIPIAIHTGGVEFVDHHSPIRKAVTRKANKYGKLSCPFIVAINCLEPVDDIDVMNALFGQERFHIPIIPNREILPEDIVFSRAKDGAWTNPIGPRYTRISGVLLAMNLRPWSIEDSKVCLYHNPWAEMKYDSVLNALDTATLIDERMRWDQGIRLSEILAG